MNKFYLILISIFFVTSFSTAEIVNQIEITGNKRVSDETIKVYGDIKEVGSDFTSTDLDNILKNLYSTNFFEDVNIEIIKNKLTIKLNEYPLINEIVLSNPNCLIYKRTFFKLLNVLIITCFYLFI